MVVIFILGTILIMFVADARDIHRITGKWFPGDNDWCPEDPRWSIWLRFLLFDEVPCILDHLPPEKTLNCPDERRSHSPYNSGGEYTNHKPPNQREAPCKKSVIPQ